MSLCLRPQYFRRSASALSVAGAALLLAGCSTLGMGGGDGMVTGSTTQTGQARWDQQMPSVAMAQDSRFVPPANIGGGGAQGIIDRRTAQPMGTQQASVSSQDLPPLQSSSVTSTQEMSAQPAVASTSTQSAPPPSVVASQPASSPGGGYTHTITSGESLYTIARKYDVSASDIVAANDIDSPDRIRVGQKLTIPGRTDLLEQRATTRTASATPVANNGVEPLSAPDGIRASQPAQQQAAAPSQSAPAAQQPAQQETQVANVSPQQPAASSSSQSSGATATFRWPLNGRVITDFAASKGTGINIEAPEGTTIRSTEAGEVIYVGNAVEGYGNLVLIKHSNGFVSAYAHLKDIAVSKGASVGRGDSIGSVGMTGSVSRPQLHFELRRGATPIDPVPHLAG